MKILSGMEPSLSVAVSSSFRSPGAERTLASAAGNLAGQQFASFLPSLTAASGPDAHESPDTGKEASSANNLRGTIVQTHSAILPGSGAAPSISGSSVSKTNHPRFTAISHDASQPTGAQGSSSVIRPAELTATSREALTTDGSSSSLSAVDHVDGLLRPGRARSGTTQAIEATAMGSAVALALMQTVIGQIAGSPGQGPIGCNQQSSIGTADVDQSQVAVNATLVSLMLPGMSMPWSGNSPGTSLSPTASAISATDATSSVDGSVQSISADTIENTLSPQVESAIMPALPSYIQSVVAVPQASETESVSRNTGIFASTMADVASPAVTGHTQISLSELSQETKDRGTAGVGVRVNSETAVVVSNDANQNQISDGSIDADNHVSAGARGRRVSSSVVAAMLDGQPTPVATHGPSIATGPNAADIGNNVKVSISVVEELANKSESLSSVSPLTPPVRFSQSGQESKHASAVDIHQDSATQTDSTFSLTGEQNTTSDQQRSDLLPLNNDQRSASMFFGSIAASALVNEPRSLTSNGTAPSAWPAAIRMTTPAFSVVSSASLNARAAHLSTSESLSGRDPIASSASLSAAPALSDTQALSTALTPSASPQPTTSLQAAIHNENTGADTVAQATMTADLEPPTSQVARSVRDLMHGSGVNGQITLQLTPSNLGNVRISIQRNDVGTTHIEIAVEKADTLETIQRTQADLHRTLTMAGVPTEGRTMNFSLASPDTTHEAVASNNGLVMDAGSSFSGHAHSQSNEQHAASNGRYGGPSTPLRWVAEEARDTASHSPQLQQLNIIA